MSEPGKIRRWVWERRWVRRLVTGEREDGLCRRCHCRPYEEGTFGRCGPCFMADVRP